MKWLLLFAAVIWLTPLYGNGLVAVNDNSAAANIASVPFDFVLDTESVAESDTDSDPGIHSFAQFCLADENVPRYGLVVLSVRTTACSAFSIRAPPVAVNYAA
ncbi:hypothetical protein [Alteromonas sp. CYL-A6]|uniref:hypothetical protein n=1 Tax=Alteromonas nitratireducens TaxID=3390813 RepID=UPI0034B71D7A